MQTARALYILIGYILLTLPVMVVQAFFLLLRLPWAKTLPQWYHKKIGRLLGLRLHVQGEVQYNDHPVLVIANHASWLDITVLSQLAPMSFVAKHEIDSWPFFNLLARLQRTIFVNRAKKSDTHSVSSAIMQRLAKGDNVVFFPEGTSSDGNTVLPFKSALFAAVKPTAKQKQHLLEQKINFDEHNVRVQTVSVAYTRIGGLPLGRQRRYKVAWVGDTALLPHMWSLLKSGSIDVYIKVGEPTLLDQFKNRKELCRYTEEKIRTTVSNLLVNEFNN